MLIYLLIIANILLNVNNEGLDCSEGEDSCVTSVKSVVVTEERDVNGVQVSKHSCNDSECMNGTETTTPEGVDELFDDDDESGSCFGLEDKEDMEDMTTTVRSQLGGVSMNGTETTTPEDVDELCDEDDESDRCFGLEDKEGMTTTVSPLGGTSLKKSLLELMMEKLKANAIYNMYYGDNDRPVLKKLSSIKSFLTRFGYIDYIKRLFRASIMERVSAHMVQRERPFKYRVRFGQLLRDDIQSVAATIRAALKVYQRFSRLNVTGLVDSETISHMNKPRCGGKDMGEQRVSPNYMTLKDKIKQYIQRMKGGMRAKRHTLAGSRWTVMNITYKITRYPTSYRSAENRSLIDGQFAKALRFWSDVTPIVFTRLPAQTPSRNVLIDIRFERGEHGDGDPLDGTGKVLAHSYFPQYGGDVHFDDDEIWTIDTKEAVHEFGHSLGLDHSDVSDSVMNPVYPPYRPDRKLAQDDIRGIHLLYGAKEGVEEVPNLCTNASMDNIYTEKDSDFLFVFKGKHYWKVSLKEMVVDYEYPKPITDLFPEIDDKIDATIEMNDTFIYVFKRKWLYKYNGTHLEKGFPKKIKHVFPSLPESLEAAICIDGVIYGLKGETYWTYVINDTMRLSNDEQPLPIDSLWPEIPPDISAMLLMRNSLYFFKGENYYRLNKYKDEYKPTYSEPSYPRRTGLFWFGCQ